MRRNARSKNVLRGALCAVALAMLSQVASAQVTTVSDGSTGTTSGTSKTPATYSTSAVTSVGLDDGVTGLASDGSGNVYASLQYTNKVVKLSGSGTVLGKFAVGGNPTGLVVDGSNGGVLYVLNNSDNTVTKLKLDGTFLATYKVNGDGPIHAVLYGGILYIACERSNTVVRMRTDGAALGSTAVGTRPVWVAVGNGGQSNTLSTSEDSVMLAEADTAATTSAEPAPAEEPAPTTDAEPVVAGDEAVLASSPGSGSGGTVVVYVSCNKSNEVWKLSTTGGVLGKFATPRGPFGLAVNTNAEVLVACFWDGVVYRMSSTGASISKTTVGDGASGVVAYGNVLAVISNGTNSLTRLSLIDGSFISKDLVDKAPLMGTATSSSLWVGCTGSGTVAKRAL